MGTYLRFKMDQELFRRSTRGAEPEECKVTECQFIDDAAILATTCLAMETAVKQYISVAAAFGILLKPSF